MDVRDKLMKFLEENKDELFSIREVARRMKIPYSTVYWHVRLLLEGGEIKAEKHGQVKLIGWKR